jgi:hypothetical protein
MILYVSHYRCKSETRQAQLLECLDRNLANREISKVNLILEEGPPGIRELVLFGTGRSATRSREILHHPKVEFTWEPAGSLVVLANADIYFDESIALLRTVDLDGVLVCLSRWEDGAIFNPRSAHDSWIFKTPLRPFPCPWPLGIPGCEQRSEHDAEQAGLELRNPSRDVHSFHVDGRLWDDKHRGQKRIPRPYAHVEACGIEKGKFV